MIDKVIITGTGVLACRNQDGTIAWRRPFRNGVTNQGLDYVGGCMFANNSGLFPQFTAWYAGLINSAGLNVLSPFDVMNSHIGWAEFVGYTGPRPQWGVTEGSQTVSSNGTFSYAVTTSGTIGGLFICSSSSLGGNSGVLWSTAALSIPSAVNPGQTVTGTYQVTFSGG